MVNVPRLVTPLPAMAGGWTRAFLNGILMCLFYLVHLCLDLVVRPGGLMCHVWSLHSLLWPDLGLP